MSMLIHFFSYQVEGGSQVVISDEGGRILNLGRLFTPLVIPSASSFLFILLFPFQYLCTDHVLTCSHSDSQVKDLSAQKFPDKNSNFIWLIQYTKSNCNICKEQREVFIALSTKLYNEGIRVGHVDCDAEQTLCKDHKIHRY